MEKCYSTNDEDFKFTEFSDLIDELESNGDLAVSATYYEADFRRITAKDIVSMDRVVEDMDERMYDLVGEAAEDGIDVSKEAEEELEAFLIQWCDKHADISRYYTIVGKSREMKITEADLPDDYRNEVHAAAGGLTQTALEG